MTRKITHAVYFPQLKKSSIIGHMWKNSLLFTSRKNYYSTLKSRYNTHCLFSWWYFFIERFFSRSRSKTGSERPRYNFSLMERRRHVVFMQLDAIRKTMFKSPKHTIVHWLNPAGQVEVDTETGLSRIVVLNIVWWEAADRPQWSSHARGWILHSPWDENAALMIEKNYMWKMPSR